MTAIENSGISRVLADNDAAIDAHDEYYAGVAKRLGATTRWAVYESGIRKLGDMPYVGNYSMVYADENGSTYVAHALEGC